MGRKQIAWLLLVAALLVAGCSTPAEKRQKFFDKGTALYQQGQYVKALLEFRNAVQQDPKFAQGYFMAGMANLKQGKLKEGFSFLSKAVEVEPGHVAANLELGKLLLGARQLDKAREKAAAVLAREPGNRDGLELTGAILIAEKKGEEARAVLEPLLTAGPQDDDIYLLLATVYRQLGDEAKAGVTLERGVADKPRSVGLHLALASLAGQQGDKARVERLLRQVIVLAPGQSEHRLRLAGLYWQQERRPEAKALLKQVIDKDPANDENWAAVGGFYLQGNDPRTAEQVLRDGLAKNGKSFRLRFLLKEIALAKGDLGSAMDLLRQCLELDKENAAYTLAQLGLAQLSFRIGSIDQAEQYLAEVFKKSPNDVEGHQLNGAIQFAKGELEKAIAEYRIVLQARPQAVPLLLRLAEVHLRNHQENLALDTLRQAQNAAPDAPEVQLAMARFQARQQNFAEAESLLKKIVAAHPEALAAKRELGDFYQSREQRDQAAALYNDMIRQAPTEPSGYLRLAGLRARAKQGEEAVAVLRGGLARNPDAPVLMEGLVQLLMAGGRHQEALRVVREILTRHPKDAFVYTLLGNVHGAVKDFPAAEAAYQQAMALDPSRFEPVANLARLYVVQGKEKQAIADLGKQVTAASTPARFLLLATLHEQSRQPQQAVAVYRQGLAKYPRSWVFANNLAFLLAEQQGGDLAKAYDLARQAQLLAPGNGTVLDTLGWIAFKRGRNEEARAVLSLAAAGNGQPTVNYHLAMVLLQLGDKKQARERLQAAVDAPADFPERPAAKRALAGLAS